MGRNKKTVKLFRNITATSGQPVNQNVETCAFVDANLNIVDPFSPGAGIGGSLGATDNKLVRTDGTGGATIQAASQITVDDNGKMTIDVSTEEGLKVVSSLGAGAGLNLVMIETTNVLWDRPMLRINGVSSLGGAANIRIDDPNPDIEFIETGQVSPAGKFEIAINEDIFQINGRNAADNSFEQILNVHRLEDGGMVGIGATAGDVPNARLEVAVPGSKSYFMLSPTVGAPSGDVLDVDTNGNFVLNDRGDAVTLRMEGDTNANLFFVDGVNDRVGILTNSPTVALDIFSDAVRLRTAKTPSSATDTGATGTICWDANYIYVCISTNVWRRIAHATW